MAACLLVTSPSLGAAYLRCTKQLESLAAARTLVVVSCGVNTAAGGDGWSLLHLAAEKGDEELVPAFSPRGLKWTPGTLCRRQRLQSTVLWRKEKWLL